ncbi:hypothetical protein WJX74_000081 [Apatococcus lobatus]|uniref:Uncharacterized protein n=1 Tax=Apatococcus lobatus TaxID=904363 RepID=A0AAW1R002_9CHLO
MEAVIDDSEPQPTQFELDEMLRDIRGIGPRVGSRMGWLHDPELAKAQWKPLTKEDLDREAAAQAHQRKAKGKKAAGRKARRR